MKTAKKIKDTFDTFELFDINSLGKKNMGESNNSS